MTSILVLGGGQQGRIIANDLRSGFDVAVADARPGAGTIQSDLSDGPALRGLMSRHDLVVGALPSHLGLGVMRAAIEAKKNLVDVSFCAEDAVELDAAAKQAGIAILPDCGLAPGLSNLLVGKAKAELGTVDEVHIAVGGIPQDRSMPYGYVVTWSVEDLWHEYTRPARIVRDGIIVSAPALSELERIGEFEAFLTDGLRSLLFTMPGARTMDEKTMRWPGHVDAIRPLIERRTLVETFKRECVRSPAMDRVVMRVEVRGPKGRRLFELEDRFDPKTGLTAMARTTALTCAAVARWLAQGPDVKGVLPMELLPQAAPFVLDRAKGHGIRIRESR